MFMNKEELSLGGIGTARPYKCDLPLERKPRRLSLKLNDNENDISITAQNTESTGKIMPWLSARSCPGCKDGSGD